MQSNYKYRILPSNTRGKGDYGWLNATYLYSFSNFYDPNRLGFRNLLVINHDIIGPVSGFGSHSHRNMEIITIPLKGVISHQDDTGAIGRVKTGNIQYMSAGTLITHSEINNEEYPCELLQIWIQPKIDNQKPYYTDQIIGWDKNMNMINRIVDKNDNLDAKLYITTLDNNNVIEIVFEFKNQLIYAIKGDLTIKLGDQKLNLAQGDTIEIQDNYAITIVQNQNNVQFLLIEII